MDITTTSQSPVGTHSAQGGSAAREPLRLDAASWVAIAAFVAYVGVGLLA